MSVVRSVLLPFVRVEYDRSPPSREGPAVSRARSIGVAFTSQAHAVWELAGKSYEGRFPTGVTLAGESDLIWRRWSDVSEAVEFWLDGQWLDRITGGHSPSSLLDARAGVQDPILIGIAVAFCRAMATDSVEPLKFEMLATAAARRLSDRPFSGGHRRIAPLDRRRLRAVCDYVEANLGETVSLEAMARLTGVSLFHFAKRFTAATGMSPHAYVVGRRMTRAMELLRRRWSSVDQVAKAVGYSQVGHFRRQFAAHWGQRPGRLEGRWQ